MEAINPDVPIFSENKLPHETYMRRALELARNGRGKVSPNPLVGCVIVHGDKVVGEGWHKQYGGPHAEVNAINDVGDKSILSECTLYVSLEPCSHIGKTPPCADLIIHHRLPRVVVANRDPNPLVAGNGIDKLRNAGIEVVDNVLADAGYQLNRRFFTYMEERRPRIILKWAETSDGFIARKDHNSKWISDAYSRQLVHKWRTEEDAVMVASGTAWYDNPTLNVRNWSGRDPVRVVIDRYLKLGANQRLFDGTQRTICYNLSKDGERDSVLYVKVSEDHMLESVVSHLYSQQIQSVIVEGGAQLLNSFIHAGLWDEARIFVSPKEFKTGIAAPTITGDLKMETKLADDLLRIVERKTEKSHELTHNSPLTTH